jgi:hypothetical protein
LNLSEIKAISSEATLKLFKMEVTSFT